MKQLTEAAVQFQLCNIAVSHMWTNSLTVLLKLLRFCQHIFCTAIAIGNVNFQKICNSFPPFTTKQNKLQTKYL